MTATGLYGTVIRSERLSPAMMRVVLGGAGLAGFADPAGCDAYVNCFFLPPGVDYSPPFDADDTRELPREQRPFPRRITVSAWDAEAGELTLDIASHGDSGYAGPWAATAQPGDRLQLRGPAGDFSPSPSTDVHLLVGDESAWPAIAACAAAAPPGMPVFAVVEVDSPRHELPLTSPGRLQVTFVHRNGADDPARLLEDAVHRLALPEGPVSAFVHGEAESIRRVRRHLLTSGLDIAELSCSPYWRRGMTDEEWRSVKGEFVKAMSAEA